MLTQMVRSEDDIYLAVSKMKYVMRDLPFTESQVQCVVVSLMEITRNVLDHGGGEGNFCCDNIVGGVRFTVIDQGPGIANVEDVLNGRFTSCTGLGLGLSGTKRLMDELIIETSKKGTKIIAVKRYAEQPR